MLRPASLPFVMGVGLLLGFLPFYAQARTQVQAEDPAVCANQQAQEAYPGHNVLSVVEGPQGLLVEMAAGDWGRKLGPGLVLSVDCTASESTPLEIPGVADISDPWYDRESGRLFFVSRGPQPDSPGAQRDVWVSGFDHDGWSAATRLGSGINSEADEYSPVLRGNTLYFASARDGQGDLYRVGLDQNSQDPQRLGPAINSKQGEWNLWVSDSEDVIVFEASGRATNQSVPGDLYLSVRDRTGKWRPAAALSDLNGRGSELNARLIGQQLVFASQAPGSSRVRLRSVSYREILQKANKAFDLELLVANRSSHSLTTLNLMHGDPVAEVGTGKGPHLLSASPSGMRVAAAAYGIFPKRHNEAVSANPGWVEEGGGEVTLWERRTGLTQQIASTCRHPHGSTWQDEQNLWLSCEDREGLVLLKPGEPAGSARFLPSLRKGAHVLAWDPLHTQILATHTGAGGLWFQPVDGGPGEFLALGEGSEALSILPGGARALVSIGPSRQVALVELGSRSISGKLDLECRFPIDFATDLLDRVWVACMFSQEVVQLDPDSGQIEARIPLHSGPLNIVAHPTQAILYASLPRLNQVQEIALASGQVSRVFDVGVEPDGLLILPSVH